MPSHIQTLEKTATKAECNIARDICGKAPMRCMPRPKKKFPAELRMISSATIKEVLNAWDSGEFMNARFRVPRRKGKG